jgi:vacuolar-type H+-ATPase subunit H
MARNRRSGDEHDASDARGKLSRLLETENELDELLEAAKREAAALLREAKKEAQSRVDHLEAELDAENDALRAQVERERDETIASIREGAAKEIAALDELDDAKAAELAKHAIQLLIGEAESGGRS